MKAVVKWFDQARGFGFLIYEDRQKQPKEIFAHYSQVKGEGYKALIPGETVQFDIAHTDKGIQASNIERDPDIANRVWRRKE